MKYSFPRRKYTKGTKKTTKAKKVKTTPTNVPNVVKLQKQINAITKKMAKETEIKEFDFGVISASVAQVNGQGVGVAPTNAYGYGVLNIAIAEGTANGEHIGNTINLKRLKWRCQVQNMPTSSTSGTAVSGLVTPMNLKLEIWQMLGDPNTALSINSFVQDSKLPNYFYLVNQGYPGSPPTSGFCNIYDTTCLDNPQYNISKIAKRVFTKKIYIPQEQFATSIGVKQVNFNVPLKDIKVSFNEAIPAQLQTSYFYILYASTGNASAANIVDPAYTKGLASVAPNSGVRFMANVRLEYIDV